MEQTKKINISVPRRWNDCTVEQLELIASVMQEQLLMQDRYHRFSMRNVKVALFFALSGLEIVEGPNPRVPVEEQYYTCRLSKDGGKRRWWQWRRKPQGGTFSVYLWQVNYWLSPKAKTNNKQAPEYIAQGAALLDWLDNNDGAFLTKFPYPALQRRRRLFDKSRAFQGPMPDLDGFSWAQYRFATDTMSNYMQLSNNLLKMQEAGSDKFSAEQLLTQTKNADLARAMFLATIFNAKTEYVDTNTGMVKYGFHYESNQCSDNAPYFRAFPDERWQVILFWWTGITHLLSKRYPHVFTVRKVARQKQPSTPLELYTATTATMQKYAGLTEDQVNHQSYSLVLEHLERIAKESEEADKISRKK